MYEDPFVKKYKNKYGLLRKIHYQERIKLKNTNQLIPIEDKISEVVQSYNKWTERPHKKLFIFGDSQVILAFILQLMGNIK